MCLSLPSHCQQSEEGGCEHGEDTQHRDASPHSRHSDSGGGKEGLESSALVRDSNDGGGREGGRSSASPVQRRKENAMENMTDEGGQDKVLPHSSHF